MIQKGLMAALILLCIAASARADSQRGYENINSGSDLESKCTSTAVQDEQDCAQFVAIHIAMTRTLQERSNSCFWYDAPPELTTEQAVNVVTDWLREHRDRGEIEAMSVVGSAMQDSFPCNK
jgi:hypothetical protein